MTRRPPDGYPVLSYCRSCGRDFASDRLFDRHRVGVHAYTLEEGLRMEPLVEDGRRCMDADELREAGLRPMTDDELRASRRDRRRAGFAVELWFDPAGVERARRGFAGRRQRAALDGAEALGVQVVMSGLSEA